MLAVLGLGAGGSWLVLGSPVLAVDRVVVEGADRLPTQAILDAAHVPRGAAMVRLDRAAIADRVRTLAPVADVEVDRRWPSTVALVVTERTPAAVLSVGHGFRLVDADGVAFAAAAKRPKGLPLISGVPAAAVDRLRAATVVAAGLPDDLAKHVVSVSARSADAVVLQLTHHREVVWGAASDASAKVAVLRVLMQTQQAAVYDVSAPAAPTTRR